LFGVWDLGQLDDGKAPWGLKRRAKEVPPKEITELQTDIRGIMPGIIRPLLINNPLTLTAYPLSQSCQRAKGQYLWGARSSKFSEYHPKCVNGSKESNSASFDATPYINRNWDWTRMLNPLALLTPTYVNSKPRITDRNN
jgi:hypothetical protein